jgi:hypothetical protein
MDASQSAAPALLPDFAVGAQPLQPTPAPEYAGAPSAAQPGTDYSDDGFAELAQRHRPAPAVAAPVHDEMEDAFAAIAARHSTRAGTWTLFLSLFVSR